MAFTRDWLETNPIDHTKFKVQPGGVRELKVDISDRLKDFLYGFATGETDIGAKSIPFISQGTAAPDTGTGIISVYANTASGKPEIFFIDEDGNIAQLTKVGKINSAILSPFANDTYIVGLNTAGTGNINLIKVNSSDKAQLPDGAVMATTGAPAEDAGIVNKKYVDDEIAAIVLPSFGAWQSQQNDVGGGGVANYTVNLVYLAATDGIFVFSAFYNGGGTALFYSDGSNPPTTLRVSISGIASNTGLSYSCPVKKGDYFKFSKSGGNNLENIMAMWIPLGS